MPGQAPTVTPFFESPPSAGGKRLLLVSYHFPPDRDVGALRWEMMLRHAAGRGWTADVLMMGDTGADAIDRSRLDGLPRGTRLYGVKLPSQPFLSFLQFLNRLTPRARRKQKLRMLE